LIRLSANLGFLWTELDLVDAIHAAKQSGFDAVECHWPFVTPAADIKKALLETNIPMVSLNTLASNPGRSDFGLCALPIRQAEAKEAIRQAISYATAIAASNIHVMAGKAAKLEGAMDIFLENLTYASELAEQQNITILIEPINREDVPDYFLADMQTAVDIVTKLNRANIKILFDCYHIQKIHGELQGWIDKYLDLIGHIQIAAVPSRHEPDEGEVDYSSLLRYLDGLGYKGFVGAEYKPRTTTEAGLSWIPNIATR
jgi:hydroxypyruvate isomerase